MLDDIVFDDVVGWVHSQVPVAGAIEVTRERPWSTVARVPIVGGVAWFKACSPVQAFEPRLTAQLFARWPDLVPEVLGWDDERAWLLTNDAGTLLRDVGNPPEVWEQLLPSYAELQRGETAHAEEHLAHGVPDLRVPALPGLYPELIRRGLPLDPGAEERLRAFEPMFVRWCEELAAHDLPASIQHDDLHYGNVYLHSADPQWGEARVLDWGDSSIGHPFASLVVTFRFLERINGLHPADPWFARLRDAYLEPWGSGLTDVFELAVRVGRFAHAIAWIKQREAIIDPAERASFNDEYRLVLRRAVALIGD